MHDSDPRYQRDLKQRVTQFAKDIRTFVLALEKNIANFDDCKQLIRSSGSVAANYFEADEAVSRGDFLFRVRLCRKEAKESILWLTLLDRNLAQELEKQRIFFMQESQEFIRMFSAIIKKSQGS